MFLSTKEGNCRMKYLTISQIKEALKKAAQKGRKNNRQRNYLILKTLAETGLRVSELINLKPYNINFEECVLYVIGKGSKSRIVDFPSELSLLLQMYVKTNNIKNKENIFPLTRDGIQRITKKYAGINVHAFRHSYAINLLRKTKNIRYVQKQLGHSSLQTTESYLQFLEYEEEKKQLENLMT